MHSDPVPVQPLEYFPDTNEPYRAIVKWVSVLTICHCGIRVIYFGIILSQYVSAAYFKSDFILLLANEITEGLLCVAAVECFRLNPTGRKLGPYMAGFVVATLAAKFTHSASLASASSRSVLLNLSTSVFSLLGSCLIPIFFALVISNKHVRRAFVDVGSGFPVEHAE